MFSPAAYRKAWEGNVAFLGAPATWMQDGAPPLELRAAFAIARGTDVTVANALGVGVRIITIRAIDTAGRVPRVLDRINIAGESLTFDAVTPVVEFGELYGWRCLCAGEDPGP